MYRKLLELRRSAIFEQGHYVEWAGSDDAIFGFSREDESDKLLVLLNMSNHPTICRQEINGELVYSTHVGAEFKLGERLSLKPHQGVIIRLAKA
jgi:glycosidase